jgi:hypothetical protein
MLIDEAETVSDEEHERLVAKAGSAGTGEAAPEPS